MPMLDDILFAIQHPMQAAGGTTAEFINTLRTAYNNAQMQRMLQTPTPIVTAPAPLPPIAPLPPVAKPKKAKKTFTPEEELKQTTQAGQLMVLDQPMRSFNN